MGLFELDIDLYFWVLDTLDIKQDHRNKVDQEAGKAKFHREHTYKFENGVFVAQLMRQIRKTLIQNHANTVVFSQQLNNLKDNNIAATKKINWQAIGRDLKQLSIKLGKAKQEQIAQGNHEPLQKLIRKLYVYD